MMNYIYLFTLFFFVGCTGFKDASLTQDTPLAQLDSAEINAPSTPVLEFNNGIFYDRNSNITKWEGSHSNIGLQRVAGTSLAVNMRDVGVDWEMVTGKFAPLDFTEAPFLVMKAKTDGLDSVRVRIDLVDVDGNATNFFPQEKYIKPGELRAYIFDYDNHWIMNWPFRANVNPKRIVAIKINFNGGGPNFTGRLLIEEFKAVARKKS